MQQELEDALRAIERAEARERDCQPLLTPDYLQHVRAIAALPENQDGVDKTAVWSLFESCRRHFAAARRA